MAKFDAVITGARVVDAANGLDAVRDIGIKDGTIAEISATALAGSAARVFDMTGMVIVPGIIDSHVHLRPVEGVPCGFSMVAATGVCTVLEMSGPRDTVLDALPEYGAGLNVGLLEAAVPGETLPSDDPSAAELECFLQSCLDGGCLGAKLLGGHYPLTPEASRRFILAANKVGAYAAWHAGSTSAVGNYSGFEEAVALAEGCELHLAHINTYCRGQVKGELEELAGAIRLLSANPNIYSESYLAAMNGVSLHLGPDGRMGSKSLANTLGMLGFDNSAKGMESALRSGVFYVISVEGLTAVRITGDEAAELWLARESRITGSYDANPGFSRAGLCLAKRENGAFVVDAIGTDGGRYPRNTIVSHGLALVRFQGLSLTEFVRKTSYNPSRMLRLPNKGHLAPGADADITVLDLEHCAPVMSLIGGRVGLYKGALFGQGGTVITTPAGAGAIKARGLPCYTTDIAAPMENFRQAI